MKKNMTKLAVTSGIAVTGKKVADIAGAFDPSLITSFVARVGEKLGISSSIAPQVALNTSEMSCYMQVSSSMSSPPIDPVWVALNTKVGAAGKAVTGGVISSGATVGLGVIALYGGWIVKKWYEASKAQFSTDRDIENLFQLGRLDEEMFLLLDEVDEEKQQKWWAKNKDLYIKFLIGLLGGSMCGAACFGLDETALQRIIEFFQNPTEANFGKSLDDFEFGLIDLFRTEHETGHYMKGISCKSEDDEELKGDLQAWYPSCDRKNYSKNQPYAIYLRGKGFEDTVVEDFEALVENKLKSEPISLSCFPNSDAVDQEIVCQVYGGQKSHYCWRTKDQNLRCMDPSSFFKYVVLDIE